jgi:hypothetical protein
VRAGLVRVLRLLARVLVVSCDVLAWRPSREYVHDLRLGEYTDRLAARHGCVYGRAPARRALDAECDALRRRLLEVELSRYAVCEVAEGATHRGVDRQHVPVECELAVRRGRRMQRRVELHEQPTRRARERHRRR